MLSRLYGAVASQRRRWYDRDPAGRRRLARPVISVGGISVGGSGKTPVAAHVAATLADMGERPAVLSRGYARTHPVDGAVVVSDGRTIDAGLAEAGDEPLMLARLVPSAAVVVCEDRYLAGRLAETQLGATVHVLDDGFQHLPLHRDIDLVVLAARELDDPRTLPGGRLREPPETLRWADALMIEAVDADAARRVAERFAVEPAFSVHRSLQTPRQVGTRQEVEVPRETDVVAVAGIAQPSAFFAALRDAGYSVVDTLSFPDHHLFTADDFVALERLVNTHHAAYVVTTDKDRERLLPHAPLRFPLLSVPLRIEVEPAALFRAWIVERLRSAQGAAA